MLARCVLAWLWLGEWLVGVLLGFAVLWVLRADAAVFCGDWSCFPGPVLLLVLLFSLSSSLVLW